MMVAGSARLLQTFVRDADSHFNSHWGKPQSVLNYHEVRGASSRTSGSIFAFARLRYFHQ